MPPIELGPSRPVSAVDVRIARSAGVKQETPGRAETPRADASKATTVVRSAALDAGEAPVDVERVSQIRKAVESGTYPLIPAKVSDAIIAAGYLLRNAQ